MTTLISLGYGQKVSRVINSPSDIRDVLQNAISQRYVGSLQDVRTALSTLSKLESVYFYVDKAWRAGYAAASAAEKARACRVLEMDDSEYVAEADFQNAVKQVAMADAIRLAVDYGFVKEVA